MKKYWLFILLFSMVMNIAFSMGGCSRQDDRDNRVVIYSSCSQLRNTAFMEMLQSQFPDYKIEMIYLNTGELGARILAEGSDTDADIVLGLELSQIRKITDLLADISDYDISNYMPDLLDASNKFLPWERFANGIAYNEGMLNDLGLPIPTSYEDLLDPIYQGLIIMPDPKVSSTGYLYLTYFVESMGEDEAFAYFAELAKNIPTFPSSGSGVSTALADGDAAIGFISLHNAVTVMERGAPLTITFFDGYSPSSMGGTAMTINGKKKSATVEVFDYLLDEVSKMDKELYSPGKVYLDQKRTLEHYPEYMPYKIINFDAETLERLQDRWNF